MAICKLCNAEFSSLIQMQRHEEWHDPKINLKSKNRILNKTCQNIWIKL